MTSLCSDVMIKYSLRLWTHIAEPISLTDKISDFNDITTVICPSIVEGATENAGVENAIRSKLQGWKMQEWKKQE